MNRLSSVQVRAILGDVDDITVARVIGTDADAATLMTALREVERELLEARAATRVTPGSAAHERARTLLLELMTTDAWRDELSVVDIDAATD